jgi:hypothetical protein
VQTIYFKPYKIKQKALKTHRYSLAVGMLEELKTFEEHQISVFLKKKQELDEKYQEKLSELDASVLKTEEFEKSKLTHAIDVEQKTTQAHAKKQASSYKSHFAAQLAQAKSQKSAAAKKILTELF